MLTITAPAKINLTLEVLGKRDDDYHEIRSVIQTISLCDIIKFQVSKDLNFKSNSPDWQAEKSLMSKAFHLMHDATGYSKGVTIELEKHIPLISGLGGDSSDAAALLRGLNQKWKTRLPREELAEMAAQLGSDVTFFLYGGTALLEGRGEKVIPLPSLPHRWVVLVIPAAPRFNGKTEQLYKGLKSNHYTDGNITQNLILALTEGREITSEMLFNTFENLSFKNVPAIENCREHLLSMGVENLHLAGSGPTLYTMVKEKTQAEELYNRIKEQNLETYLAETVSPTKQTSLF